MKKKKESLSRYANEATAAGMTYGKKQAQEYAGKVKIGRVPEGYRKQGSYRDGFTRKKWEEDL